MTAGQIRIGVAAALVILVAAAAYFVVGATRDAGRMHAVAYFQNSNGIFTGDEVRIRGVKVGTIERIEPEPSRVRISFWFDDTFKVPADAKAVILSPTLVTARAIQLTPPYTGGPTLGDGAVIPEDRTAVPMEWDDFRIQLQKLTEMLAPTKPGGVSTLGALVDTAADNLRGQGANIRDAIIKFSQAVSALGDHSADTFTSVKNLAKLVSALQDSTVILRELNGNLASVTGLLANDPNEIGNAVRDLNGVVDEVKTFVADNRETLGTTSDKLTAVSQILNENLDGIEQLLHILPTTAANAVNLYQPAQGTLSGIAAVNNFANPINFLCGAIEAASRLGAEQSSKLCVQYLAPIVKNRQYNFPPIGANPFVGAAARPNELTYSEDWMRPDYVPPQPDTPNTDPPFPAEAQPTDPTAGLPGLMVPHGAGS
ncbi:MAG: virulence factor Mce family protein [Mycobacterium sp.]|jgi:phospholipid/cholesterol/gamma-HCH transport system substrate-binding protein|nr:virulence factor Mce family protein [Mycobacterium sp.]